MAKPKPVDPGVMKKILVPLELKRDIDLLLFDPRTGRTGYGLLANLMRELFTKWLEKDAKKFRVEKYKNKEKVESEQLVFELPKSLALKIEVILIDPDAGRIVYGAFSKVGVELLQAWVDSKKKGSGNE